MRWAATDVGLFTRLDSYDISEPTDHFFTDQLRNSEVAINLQHLLPQLGLEEEGSDVVRALSMRVGVDGRSG
jgi:hypothetical protein